MMDAIIEQLLTEVEITYKEQSKLTDSVLSALSYVFDQCLLQALDLIDRQCVLHISSASGREVYQVKGNSGALYLCLKNSNYCSCPAYKFSVVRKGQTMCKHKLAVLLSKAMGLCKEVNYADETVALMLAGIS